jgi:diaminopimelate epimerase
MSNRAAILFTKFHGLHNDFLVARLEGRSRHLAKLARSITDRHTGVGADGFLVVGKPRRSACDARVRFFNADGSEAEMSGNGIRCVGAFLLKPGRAARRLRIETPAGVRVLDPIRIPKAGAPSEWIFRVSMGEPILDPARIPFKAGGMSAPLIGFPLEIERGMLRVTVTSMGNPHCSVFVGGFASIDWRKLGRQIERSRFFPRRTNVEFVKVISRNKIEVRFWERGVGETVSSGTGSCAAVVASILNGFADRSVRVLTPAGSLQVDWPQGGEVSLTGPAAVIAEGRFYC